MSGELMELRIQLRIAELRVLAARTALAYWRERRIEAEAAVDAAIARLRHWPDDDWRDWPPRTALVQ